MARKESKPKTSSGRTSKNKEREGMKDNLEHDLESGDNPEERERGLGEMNK